jgi:hypothetical protein
MITTPEPATRSSAIFLVTSAFRGDAARVRWALDACDEAEFVPMFHASLDLMRELARKLRSPEGLMSLDVWLSEISHDEHHGRDERLAARLILAHAMTCYPPVETVAVAETFGPIFNAAASTFNEVCTEADYRIVDVFAAALALWRTLLPEVNTTPGACVVCITAGQLWASAEPEGTSKLRIREHDSPPQPTLAIPPEAEVVRRPPQPTIPAGAPVSYRGLSIRLAQERGTW